MGALIGKLANLTERSAPGALQVIKAEASDNAWSALYMDELIADAKAAESEDDFEVLVNKLSEAWFRSLKAFLKAVLIVQPDDILLFHGNPPCCR